MKNWIWTDEDEAAARALRARLPQRIFDAHAHLYRRKDCGRTTPFIAAGPDVAGINEWRTAVSRQLGATAQLSGGLFAPLPAENINIGAANAFLIGELNAYPEGRGLVTPQLQGGKMARHEVAPYVGPDLASGHWDRRPNVTEPLRGLLLIGPDIPRKDIEALLSKGPVIGFKPYHLMGRHQPSFEAPIHSYVPEWAWELAHERKLVILLHLVKSLALADTENQREIVSACRKYPGAKLILAHGARGFHAPNTRSGLPSLRGLQNVWFDTSGLCEPEAIIAILDEFGPRRVMWGSDFPVSERRGKCVTIGDQFAWINPSHLDEQHPAPAIRTWPVGLENLRAVLSAAEQAALNAEDLQDVFCDNARRLLGLVEERAGLTQERHRQALALIPGGTNLLSKRPEMFAPGQWPAYFREARGCEVWDLDGRHYYDFSINSAGACLLGCRDPDVTRAVKRRLSLGTLSTLNPPEEVELAEELCRLHPWAEQVRLARTGGEVAAVAVRIARATTDRSVVAICGYHGWSDWYLAANLGQDDSLRGHLLPGLEPLGVPRELRGTTLSFAYNDRAAFERLVAEHGRHLAAVVMEPCRSQDPIPGFLEYVRDQAHQAGALLIFDEITVGWRQIHGGAHLRLGVNPDMALFAKALGNGHPIAAVIGTRSAMDGAQRSFISSSYWTESVGPVAALATLKKMRDSDVVGWVSRMGARIQQVLRSAAERHGVPLVVTGYPSVPALKFEHEQGQALKTLYTQLMLAQGFLAGGPIFVTLAHTEDIVAQFAMALDIVFPQLAEALSRGEVLARLKGPVAHSGFQRLV